MVNCHVEMSFLIRCFILVLCLNTGFKTSAQVVNRVHFYDALSKADTLKINEQLKKISQSSSVDKQAFIGVLQMRKAALVKGLDYKLNLFKSGNKQLEQAISKHHSNAEYRFLRLLIQENAPVFLNYRSEVKEDADIVKSAYVKLLVETQNAILDYCKHSKVLKVEELKK